MKESLYLMKTNQLRILPHVVKPDTSKDHYAHKNSIVLWQIWVDDKKITDTCYPFDETDSLMELSTNIEYPFFRDGGGHLSVRRTQNLILWTDLLPEESFIPSRYVIWQSTCYIFDLFAYQSACWSAIIESNLLPGQFPLYRRKNDNLWHYMTDDEVNHILQETYPKWFGETAIYREPTNPSDTIGIIILRRMQLAIQQLTDFTICDPPEKQIELRIGLDEAEFTEAIWHIGKMNGKFAIFFEQRPYFPVWLQSPEFDKVLGKEPFAEEL